MLEVEYIEVGNLQKLRMAESILRDCLLGDNYGIPEDDFVTVIRFLENWQYELDKRLVITAEALRRGSSASG